MLRPFSDCGGDIESRFTREQLLTNLTLYWVTGCIGTVMRAYYDFEHFEPALPAGARVEVGAVGLRRLRRRYRPDTARPPRELTEHLFNVVCRRTRTLLTRARRF